MNESKLIFHSGDKVFAKLKGYPHWPARVIAVMNENSNKRRYHVYFYGTNQTAVVKAENICSYIGNKSTLGKTKKHKHFNEALLEIEAEINAGESSISSEDTAGSPSATKEEMTVKPSTGPNKKKQNQQAKITPRNLKHKMVHTDSGATHNTPKKARKSSIGNRNTTETSTPQVKLEHVSPSRDVKDDFIPLTSIKQEDEDNKDGKFKVKEEKKKNPKGKKRGFIIAKHKGEKVRIPLNLNRPDFTDKETAKNWRTMILEYANSIKMRIENGERIEDVEGLMDDFTSMKSFDYFNRKLHEEHERKLRFLRIEAQLLDLDIEIKKSLGLRNANPERCIELLDRAYELNIAPLMLKKQPDVVLTIRRMRNYVGNVAYWNLNDEELKTFKRLAKRIRIKSVMIYNKFKMLFINRTMEDFWSFFAKEVDKFRAKTTGLTLAEVLSIVEESEELV